MRVARATTRVQEATAGMEGTEESSCAAKAPVWAAEPSAGLPGAFLRIAPVSERRRRRVEQAVQTGRTLLVGLGGGEVAMFLGRFFRMLVRSVLRMGAHIVSRDEFGHLRSERRRFREALWLVSLA